MVCLAEIENQYIKLYKVLRNYIWDYSVVELIAGLEVACCQAFPQIAEVRRLLDALKQAIRDVTAQDEELQVAFEQFEQLLNSSDDVYMKLSSVREVVQ